MIQCFRDTETRLLFETGRSGRYAGVAEVAMRKPAQLNAAVVLADLASPPGNRLEALRGDRRGQYSIRINQQFRICFTWSAGGPAGVEIVDYH